MLDDVIQELIQHEIEDETDNRRNNSEIEEEDGDHIVNLRGNSQKRYTRDSEIDDEADMIALDEISEENSGLVSATFDHRAKQFPDYEAEAVIALRESFVDISQKTVGWRWKAEELEGKSWKHRYVALPEYCRKPQQGGVSISETQQILRRGRERETSIILNFGGAKPTAQIQKLRRSPKA